MTIFMHYDLIGIGSHAEYTQQKEEILRKRKQLKHQESTKAILAREVAQFKREREEKLSMAARHKKEVNH